jgi:hypothetical protein
MYYFDLKKTVVHKQEKFFMNNEKTKFVRQVAKFDLRSLDIISVCGSIPIEIPILWPRAVMVGPRPRVLLTLPLVTGAHLSWVCFGNHTNHVNRFCSRNTDFLNVTPRGVHTNHWALQD